MTNIIHDGDSGPEGQPPAENGLTFDETIKRSVGVITLGLGLINDVLAVAGKEPTVIHHDFGNIGGRVGWLCLGSSLAYGGYNLLRGRTLYGSTEQD